MKIIEDKYFFNSLLDEIEEIAGNRMSRNDKLSAVCELLRKNVKHYNWVGFYIADNSTRKLSLEHFSGEPTEHTKIDFGEGICGQSAQTKNIFVVQDVSKETNYLSCSPNVKSEIVLPIFKNEQIVGELDIDSHFISPFTDEDKIFLEKVCRIVSHLFEQ